jgi:trk system potassium uptake protein TrkA
MKVSIAVIGLGRFGLDLVESLSNKDIEVLAIDINEQAVEKALTWTPHAFIADSTDEEALREVGITNVNKVVIAAGQSDRLTFANTIMTIIKVKSLGIKDIIVRIDDDSYRETMMLVGASQVISPLKIASDTMSTKITSDNIIDYFNISEEFCAYEIELPATFEDLPIIDLQSVSKYKMNILVIYRNNKPIIPTHKEVLIGQDRIYLFGRRSEMEKIANFFKRHLN